MTEREIKRNLNKRVSFTNPKLYMENAEYILSGATIRLGDKGFYYQVELTDINCPHSHITCRLEDIEEIRVCTR